MNRSLHRRLLVWVAGSSSITLLALLLLTCLVVESRLWRQFDDTLQSRLSNLAQLVEQDHGEIEFEWDDPESRISPLTDQRERITCWKDDKVVDSWPEDAEPLKLGKHRAAVRSTSWGYHPARVATIVFQPRVDRPDGASDPSELTLALATPTAGIDSTIQVLRWSLLASTAVGLCLILAGAWFAVSRGLAPLDAITDQIAKVAPGSLDERVAPIDEQPTELRPLLSTLNDVLDRLCHAIQRERALSGEIAHELRTPLAGLRAKFDVAMSKPRSAAALRATIEQCDAIVRQTAAMVESLLATVASDDTSTIKHPVNLSLAIEQTLLDFEGAGNQRGLSFAPAIEPGIQIAADEQRIRVVLRNVIENAVTYADEGSTIAVDCGLDGDQVHVRIGNRARNFSPERIEQVFERFWRADAARSATGAHAGLGLPLTQRIVAQIGGEIGAAYQAGSFVLELTWNAGRETNTRGR